jgi:mono/diheme cytochrome c family protein
MLCNQFETSPRAGAVPRESKKDHHMRRRLLILGGAILLAIGGTIGEEIVTSSGQVCAASAKASASFAEDVMPIFVGRCFSCHKPGGQGNEKSGLDLSSYEGVMKGTKSGKMVIPGDADASNLIWLLEWRGAPETHMPLGKKKLSICDRDAIRAWINEGAKDN